LDQKEDFFHDMFRPGMMLLRILHYPSQNTEAVDFASNQIGCGTHTDYGCVAILAQDTDGLQVRNRRGAWVAAPPLEGCLLVNLGDMMERWTNGLYRATPHRVLNTSSRSRYSIPFFFRAQLRRLRAASGLVRDAGKPLATRKRGVRTTPAAATRRHFRLQTRERRNLLYAHITKGVRVCY